MGVPATPVTLLSATLAGAVTADVTAGVFAMPSGRLEGLVLYANFVRAGGGTTAKAWVQTSFDGTNWMDIANFAFTTTSAIRAYHLTNAAVTSIATPVDGTTADNTAVDGFLGPLFRVKLTTTGTYTGASSFTITAHAA
jgi:hypothetical protein